MGLTAHPTAAQDTYNVHVYTLYMADHCFSIYIYFFIFLASQDSMPGSAASSIGDFSAIKELDKITKEIEDLGR